MRVKSVVGRKAHAMSEFNTNGRPSRVRFYTDVAFKAGIGIVLLGFGAASFGSALDRFGGLAAFLVLLAYLVFVFGFIGMWGAAGDWRALRCLRTSRLSRLEQVSDGDRVAVTGTIEVSGDPLVAPFSEQPCAAYTYRVIGSRSSTHSTGSTGQMALQGFAMQPMRLAGDGLVLTLAALPEAESELTAMVTGGDWGQRARGWLDGDGQRRFADDPDADSHARLSNAMARAAPPLLEDYVICRVNDAGSALRISEELIPCDRPVTVLGTYEALDQALSGRGGKMMVYDGTAADVEHRLARDMRENGRLGLICAVLGAGVCLVAPLWPAAS